VSKLFTISNLHVSVGEKPVLQGVDLEMDRGSVHAVMGPNGSGKSSLAYTIMGHPRYAITEGSMLFEGHELNELPPHKRAKLGIFLAMQHPFEVEGVPYKDFLRQAYNALYDGTDKQLRIRDFHAMLLQKLELLKMDKAIIDRPVNVGFSGGEKKRAEMLQLAVLQPKLVILDEIDSGLDVDALKIVLQALDAIRTANPSMTVLLITHYRRVFEYCVPDVVHVMQQGRIVKTGSVELAHTLDEHGFEHTS
jgi:Fe-S cluster assembly ATP-binding protein